MTAATVLAGVPTQELRAGDLVLVYGMRVRLDEVQVRDDNPSGRRTYAWDGTVVNVDEVQAAGRVPVSFLTEWSACGGRVVRQDAWTVQGNDLATWTVERAG